MAIDKLMTAQNDILNNFLQGSISKSEFLQNLLDLDRETPEHENCFANIKVLEDEEIKQIFESSDDETKFIYYHYLRLSYFHAFQYEACNFGTTEKALDYIEKANQLSSSVDNIFPNEDPLFTKYILGTLYYIKNDSKNLALVIDDYEQGDKNDLIFSNIEVLKKLYEGLISTNSVDYKRDY